MHLFQVAYKLFSENGYHPVSYTLIAEKAGVIPSSVQYYYPKKSTFIEYMFDQVLFFCQTYIRRHVRSSYEGYLAVGMQMGYAFLLSHHDKSSLSKDLLCDRTLCNDMIKKSALLVCEYKGIEEPLEMTETINVYLLSTGGLYSLLNYYFEDPSKHGLTAEELALRHVRMFVDFGYLDDVSDEIIQDTFLETNKLDRVVSDMNKFLLGELAIEDLQE